MSKERSATGANAEKRQGNDRETNIILWKREAFWMMDFEKSVRIISLKSIFCSPNNNVMNFSKKKERKRSTKNITRITKTGADTLAQKITEIGNGDTLIENTDDRLDQRTVLEAIDKDAAIVRLLDNCVQFLTDAQKLRLAINANRNRTCDPFSQNFKCPFENIVVLFKFFYIFFYLDKPKMFLIVSSKQEYCRQQKKV
ncbi:hypothetical protein RFI_05589, partial [Reticulomyxa filosa]